MIDTVCWRRLPGKLTARTDTYEERDDAITDARLARISGLHPIDVSVIDDAGHEHYSAVFG